MFDYKETRDDRKKTLDLIFNTDQSAGFLIACADFEWTVKRVILAIGKSTTKEIREHEFVTVDSDQNLRYVSSLPKYKAIWKREVASLYGDGFDALLNQKVKANTIPGYKKERRGNTWEILDTVFSLRNRLVHGVRSHVGDEISAFAFHFMVKCSDVLTEYAEKKGVSIYGKKLVRIKPRG